MAAGRPITGINISTGAAYSALAFGDGSTDDTSTIQSAISACGLIFMPAGVYKVTSTLTFPAYSNVGIIGASAAYSSSSTVGTCIYYTPTTGDAVRFDNSGTGHPTMFGVAIIRPTVASSGYGISCNIITDALYFSDVYLSKHRVGTKLAEVGYGSIDSIRVDNCGSHGLEICGQYQISKCLSAINGGDGVHVVGNSGGSSQGQWTGIASFLNGGNGISFYGAVGSGIFGIRLSDSFFGDDGGYGIYLDTQSGTQPSTFTNIYIEGEPANSMYLAANSGWNNIVGCTFGGGNPCVLSLAPVATFTGCNFNYGSGFGVHFFQGKGSVIGCTFFNNAGPAIAASVGVNGFTAIGNYVSGNVGGTTDISVASNTYVAGNY